MAKIASFHNVCEDDPDLVLITAIHSFKQLVRKIKSIKVHNPITYYYGIVKKKLDEIYLQDAYCMVFEIVVLPPIFLVFLVILRRESYCPLRRNKKEKRVILSSTLFSTVYDSRNINRFDFYFCILTWGPLLTKS